MNRDLDRVHGQAEVGQAIVDYLRDRHPHEPSVGRLLNRLSDLTPLPPHQPTQPPHPTELAIAISELCSADDDGLATVGRVLQLSAARLSWRVDDGLYYRDGPEPSEGYRRGNMHAPRVEGDDFAMGLFLLGPGVDYLDHRHDAPELYLNLTGPTRWRFDWSDWQELPRGSVVWNPPGRVHATRSGDAPWLSFWAWLHDIEEPCEVAEPPQGYVDIAPPA